MIVREHINFERGLDPKIAMGIGDPVERAMNSVPGKILKVVVELFGNTEMWYNDEQYLLRTGKPKWLMHSTLPMSQNDWKLLKDKCKQDIDPNFKWSKRYSKSVRDMGMLFKELDFTMILTDIFDKTKFWYFDDIDLVQVDLTIVHVHHGMKFGEMIKDVLQSDRLEIK